MGKKTNFFLGAGIGLGLGLLFAPKSGKETRQDLAKMFNDLYEKAKEIDVEEIKNAIIVKTKELETMIKDLDKETAKKVKTKTAELLKSTAEKLEEPKKTVRKTKKAN